MLHDREIDPAARKMIILPRYDESGASSRVRFYQYRPLLESAGWRVDIAPLMDAAIVDRIGQRKGLADYARLGAAYTKRISDALSAGSYSVAWIEKELMPFVPGPLERLLTSARTVVDFDDAIFHNYDLSRSRLVRRILSKKFDRTLPGTSAVTAGSRYLSDFAKRAGAETVIDIPSTVDLDRYPPSPMPGEDTLRVGWIGSRTTTKHLAEILPAIAQASRRAPLKLVTIGALPLDHGGLQIEQHAWSGETEVAVMQSCHVGIMPLPDNPFERGKCAFKLIQFMAAGRPVIASPIGANIDVVSPDVGRLAHSDRDWVEALLSAQAERSQWAQMGLAARAKVETHYALDVVGSRLVALFDRLSPPA